MKKSKLGYKRYSPDVNNPYNIIPSGRITMQDVDFPVYGVDDMGNARMMYPGGEYQFPGNQVFELPMAQNGLNWRDVAPRPDTSERRDATYVASKLPVKTPPKIDPRSFPVHTVSKYEEPSTTTKVLNTLANPVESFGYSARGQRIPDRVGTSSMDMALDIVNPFAWANYARKSVNDLTEGDFVSAGFNALGAIPLVGFADDAGRVLNYATTQTPLRNTYKYNPYAFKPNPEAYYHRSPNLNNIINKETGMLQGFGQSEAGKAYTKKALESSKIINLKRGANSQLYFSKGVPLDYGRYNRVLDRKTGKMIAGQGYSGPYIVEVKGVPMGSSTKGSAPGLEPTGIGSYAVSKRPIFLDEAIFYKEDWLRGYKPLDISKQTGGEQLQTPQPFIRSDFFTPEQIRKARIDAAKDRPLTFEGRINKALGNPKEKAADLAQAVAPRGEGPVDNVRHTVAGMYTADAIANQLSPYPIGPTTVVPKIAGFVGSNLAGLAHEARAFIPSLEGDYRNIPAAARMTAEDMVNNFVGSALSLNPFMTDKEKEDLIVKLSDENYLPDGYEQMNSKHPRNLYVKKEYGGDLEEFGSGGLKQWFAEKWVDVKTGKECGRSGKDKDGRPYPACRPSRRVNSTTPKTTSEMSSSEKAKFKSVKTSGKRIPYNHRRAEMGGSLDFESPVTAFKYMINPEYRYQLGGITTAFTPLMVAAQAKLSSLFGSDESTGKSAAKPVDWTQMKRPDQIKYGIDQIVALEPEDRRKSLENLLEATAYMENRYGADPRAYGRSYTSSFMSIDPIALKDMFTGRGNKGTYNAAQQSQIENFKRLNLPTDQKQFDARLRKDDPVAAMAAARYRYAMSPQALPDPNNPQQMFDYWLTNYNGKGILKHQTRDQAYKEFLKGYKMAIGND